MPLGLTARLFIARRKQGNFADKGAKCDSCRAEASVHRVARGVLLAGEKDPLDKVAVVSFGLKVGHRIASDFAQPIKHAINTAI